MLVRWLVTQSRLQKLGSTGISRSLATSPSGKKPNRPSSNVPRKIEDPPPGGGVWRYSSLKSRVFIDSEADPGLDYGSVITRERAGAPRITSRCRSYLAGFLSWFSSFSIATILLGQFGQKLGSIA